MTNPQSLSVRNRTWWRVLAWTLVLAVALEGAWLALFTWSVRSGRLLALANRRPDKVRVEVQSVRSRWPGLLELDGLHVAGTTRRLEWEVDVDHARAQIELAALLGRTLRFHAIDADGVRVRSRHRDAATKTSHAPAARPSAASPADAQKGRDSERGGDATGRQPPRWTFDFRNVRVDDVTEVVLDGTELRGRARGRIGFEIGTAAGRSEIHSSELGLLDIEVLRDGKSVGRDITGALELAVASWPYRTKSGRDLLPYATGRLVLQGELDDRPLVGEILRRVPWVEIQPAISSVRIDLRFRRGELRRGTSVRAERPPGRARILDYFVAGSNEFSLDVDDRLTRAPDVRWDLRFGDFTVLSEGEAAPLVTGSGLVLSGRAQPPRLVDLAEHTDLEVELGDAHLPDITRFARWLPPSTRLQLLGGSAAVSGSARLRLADRALSGKLETRFENARIRWSGVELAGKIDATLALAGGDLEQRTFDVSGTRFLLTDFRSPGFEPAGPAQKDGWWGDLHLEDATLKLAPRVELGGSFQARLRDTSPLVGLFELKHDLPGWASRVLTVEDLAAKGKFHSRPGRLDLDDFESGVFGGLLQARATFAGERRSGRMLLSWRKLAFGVGFHGDERTIKIAAAKDWFDAFEP